jgi:hypothetical protein
MERFEEWSSCQIHGHQFENGFCADCGEHAEADDENTAG